jgi:negative regulator of genetic competence, sporulation and motility
LEFLLIGESKIKIVLTSDEARKYRLTTSSAETCGPSARRSFWRVLDLAKAEVGFDPAGDKVLIQLYPIKDGGCEMFVTKLGLLPESSAKLVLKSDKISMLQKRNSLYAFDSLESLISSSRALKLVAESIKIKSSVYELAGKYYLLIEEYGRGGDPVEFPCVLEFATGLTADLAAYVLEHAECIAEEKAIEIFSAM